jgi:Flp pilus assembly pilin Flp
MKTQILDRKGQGMSEYLILVLFIAVSSITVARTVGKTVFGRLSAINTSLKTVTEDSVRGKGDSSKESSALDTVGKAAGMVSGALGHGSGD